MELGRVYIIFCELRNDILDLTINTQTDKQTHMVHLW